jgi:hypothetical protein
MSASDSSYYSSTISDCGVALTFEDDVVCSVLRRQFTMPLNQHDLTCGLIIKLRAALARIARRKLYADSGVDDTEEDRLYFLVRSYAREAAMPLEEWTREALWNLSTYLVEKCSLFPTELRESLLSHSLTAPKCGLVEWSSDHLHLLNAFEATILPDSFTDEEIIRVLKSSSSPDFALEPGRRYRFTCGLLLKLRTGSVRVVKRSKYRPPIGQDTDPLRLLMLLKHYVVLDDFDETCWTASIVWDISSELSQKCINLSPDLQKELRQQPLTSSDALHRKVHWSASFLSHVAAYHASVQRPAGAFALQMRDIFPLLAGLPRQECPQCHGQRQIYCGPCGGLRLMGRPEELLPPRVNLPFKVLLLLHW